MKRNERIGAMVRILCDKPNYVYTLSYFTELFDSAKSTISEDLVIVKSIMDELSLGKVETLAGAAGGVRYLPIVNSDRKTELFNEIIEQFKDEKRIIAGGFLYIADILYNPKYIKPMGELFAEHFSNKKIDCVMTVETKGIPLAMLTATTLNVPLVIARNQNKITEGSTISINYVSGSTGKIQTMYVSKKAVKSGSNVLIIDDFMRAGGTAKGMVELVHELESEVAGIGVLIETDIPKQKMVDDYFAIFSIDDIVDDKINIRANTNL